MKALKCNGDTGITLLPDPKQLSQEGLKKIYTIFLHRAQENTTCSYELLPYGKNGGDV